VQNKIPYGAVRNAAGEFVRADLAGVSAAAAAASKTMPEDFRVSITNAPGNGVYPISSFTWLLIPGKFSDATKRDAIKGFVTWMLADGQNYAETLSYAKLPKEVVDRELKAISKISETGRPEWQRQLRQFRARAPLRARALFCPACARATKSPA